MTNFDFLKKEDQFETFADAAIAAEKSTALIRRPVFSTAGVQWNLQ